MRWIILLIAGYFLYRFLRKFLATPNLPKRKPPREIQDEMVQDPVCKVYLPKRQALELKDNKGGLLYFCSPQCRESFIKKSKK